MSERLKRKADEIMRIMKNYETTNEALTLDKRSTPELIELYDGDHEWLKHPCGDLYIDASLCSRAKLTGDILKARGCVFKDGRYQEAKP